jgi:hypothetical protein
MNAEFFALAFTAALNPKAAHRHGVAAVPAHAGLDDARG